MREETVLDSKKELSRNGVPPHGEQKIKLKTESKPESAFRRGYKDINKAERTRFTNAEKYGFILEWENAERENPDITTVEFCSTKPKLSDSTFRNWLTDNQ